MANLTGKTISQLTTLQPITPNSLFIVEYSGVTYNIPYSAISQTLYIETTYSELVSMISGSTLNPGSYYLITDYRTCYDQPDFDYNGNTIISSNTYHVADIDPILVLAISQNALAIDAYQPSYPKDKIKYDYTFNVTEVTGGVAYGRITERIDEYNNRTDYDHRTVLFKRYKTYLNDGIISGAIQSMSEGSVIGINTFFTTDLTVGNVILILSNNPQYYEVTNIISNTEMTVVGFNYNNFFYNEGYFCQKQTVNSFTENGVIYYYNDVPSGSNNISDGGNDMYDTGNFLNTDLFLEIPYTHTQMTDPPINNTVQASFNDFTYNGTVQSGDTYFGTGSNYFTNQYPGLFVMTSYDTLINQFYISGDVGADGGGFYDNYFNTISGYTVFGKFIYGTQDPSVNHLMILNGVDENIVHTYSTDTNNDFDSVSGLTAITQVHYLLFALAGGVKPTNTQIQNVISSYISQIDENDINQTLSNLNLNFTGITSNLPANKNTYLSLNYKQTNITGDTELYRELPTFNYTNNFVINNYIGDYANLNSWEESAFLLANNVFLDSDYLNNVFGNGCYNNTFYDDCTNNIIGDYFYNNTTDDDFDSNQIADYFNNNYITANVQRNKIGRGFENNFIVNNDFNENLIENYFNQNVVTESGFESNKIGNYFNSNLVDANFYSNRIGDSFNNNKIINDFHSNVITNGFSSNIIYSNFYENNISDDFTNCTIGLSSPGTYTIYKNIIGTYFYNNIINHNMYSNTIKNDFYANTLLGEFYFNTIENNFYSNVFSGSCSYNKIGNYFNNNNISDGFGFGASTSQGNTIGSYFYNNIIGEYFYNNVIADGFYYNTIVNDFQLNNIQCSINNTDFTLATHVYGGYNCTIFKRNDFQNRLSYYDSSDILTINNINS